MNKEQEPKPTYNINCTEHGLIAENVEMAPITSLIKTHIEEFNCFYKISVEANET